jgi:hypothetical protein
VGQRLDQRAVGQAERGAGRLRRHADGQRVALGVRGDHLGQPAAQRGPPVRIGEPVPGDRSHAARNAHRGQRCRPQQAVPAQQIRS